MREKGVVRSVKNGVAEVVVEREIVAVRSCCGGITTTKEELFRVAAEGAVAGETVLVVSEDDKEHYRQMIVIIVMLAAFFVGMGVGNALFSVLVAAVVSGGVVSIASVLVMYRFYRKQPLQKARIERRPVEATA
jgi:hypothetical protein